MRLLADPKVDDQPLSRACLTLENAGCDVSRTALTQEVAQGAAIAKGEEEGAGLGRFDGTETDGVDHDRAPGSCARQLVKQVERVETKMRGGPRAEENRLAVNKCVVGDVMKNAEGGY